MSGNPPTAAWLEAARPATSRHLLTGPLVHLLLPRLAIRQASPKADGHD
jgi:hypothetical protein